MGILDFRLPILDCETTGVEAAAGRWHRIARRQIQNPKSKIQNPQPRRGISLLEVLISMFVLLFGLMGVAAIFPVGNHYAGKGEQYDRGAALADAAFADLKARGMLNPYVWMYAEPMAAPQVMLTDSDPRVIQPPLAPVSGAQPGTFNVSPASTHGPGHAFVLDPIGAAEAWAPLLAQTPNAKRLDMGADVFPYAKLDASDPQGVGPKEPAASNMDNPWEPATGGLPVLAGVRWPIRRLTLPVPDPRTPGRLWAMTPGTAETIFRLHDDLTSSLPDEDDHPSVQRWAADDNGTPKDPTDDIPLARQYTGSYSWIATIVPTRSAPPIPPGVTQSSLNSVQPAHSQYGGQLFDVSVAVFHKRDVTPSAQSERSIAAALNVGGELVIFAANSVDGITAVDTAVADIRPGQWIAVAGVHPTTGLFLLKWYRLLSMDDETVEGDAIGPGVPGTFALRRAMVEGPDWPPPPAGNSTVMNLRAILLPGVIGVSTQSLPMERN